MQIDKTAFLQGVANAEEENPHIWPLSHAIFRAVSAISYRGPIGRYVCDYDKLLVALAGIEAPADHWALVWRHLGYWLPSAIMMGKEENDDSLQVVG